MGDIGEHRGRVTKKNGSDTFACKISFLQLCTDCKTRCSISTEILNIYLIEKKTSLKVEL